MGRGAMTNNAGHSVHQSDFVLEAVVLAGGKGLRLHPYTTVIPKPLVPIGNEYSILEIVMRQLAASGFSKATLSVGYLGHLIQAYVGDGRQWGLEVGYVTEESPLGTIGPILTILDRLPEHFLVMNGDILTDFDYGDLLRGHMCSGAPITVATYEREHRVDFGVLDITDRQVTRFTEKPTIRYSVSMGVYAVSRDALADYCPGQPLGVDQLVIDLLNNQRPPRTYPFSGYWLDIGRPDDYDRANQEFSVTKSSLIPATKSDFLLGATPNLTPVA